ncbi:hypothetical protein HDU90_001414 [Geranomyces variabilis]|nr:hypothetical protein HDU90_001414 [Geranomyces variabilis]
MRKARAASAAPSAADASVSITAIQEIGKTTRLVARKLSKTVNASTRSITDVHAQAIHAQGRAKRAHSPSRGAEDVDKTRADSDEVMIVISDSYRQKSFLRKRRRPTTLHAQWPLIYSLNMVRFAPKGCLYVHARERKYLVENISPALKMLERTHGLLSFHWVEVQSKTTKSINIAQLPAGATDAKAFSVDVLGVMGGEEAEFLFLEQSGGTCGVRPAARQWKTRLRS